MTISTDIYSICKERPLTTPELHGSNDFYGHATVLKNYLGLPDGYAINAAIEHSVMLSTNYSWHVDRYSIFPCILTNSESRFDAYPKGRLVFAVGPYIHYADHSLSSEEISKEKSRLGKTLLAFPFHSTHHNTAVFDEQEYCDFLEVMGKAFDTVRVCLYWKDVLFEKEAIYKKRGFECVSAGHIFDPLFLPRLKSIIECSTLTTSNAWGTHIGYSVYLGKPHVIHKMKITNNHDDSEVSAKDRASDDDIKRNLNEKEYAYELFSGYREDISNAQYEYAAGRWGFSSIRNKVDLKELFGIAEDSFELSRAYKGQTINFMQNVCLSYLLNSDNERARLCLEELSKKDSMGHIFWQILMRKLHQATSNGFSSLTEEETRMQSLIAKISA